MDTSVFRNLLNLKKDDPAAIKSLDKLVEALNDPVFLTFAKTQIGSIESIFNKFTDYCFPPEFYRRLCPAERFSKIDLFENVSELTSFQFIVKTTSFNPIKNGSFDYVAKNTFAGLDLLEKVDQPRARCAIIEMMMGLFFANVQFLKNSPRIKYQIFYKLMSMFHFYKNDSIKKIMLKHIVQFKKDFDMSPLFKYCNLEMPKIPVQLAREGIELESLSMPIEIMIIQWSNETNETFQRLFDSCDQLLCLEEIKYFALDHQISASSPIMKYYCPKFQDLATAKQAFAVFGQILAKGDNIHYSKILFKIILKNIDYFHLFPEYVEVINNYINDRRFYTDASVAKIFNKYKPLIFPRENSILA